MRLNANLISAFKKVLCFHQNNDSFTTQSFSLIFSYPMASEDLEYITLHYTDTGASYGFEMTGVINVM